MTNFEVFRKGSARGGSELWVTVQKRGTVSLNRASYMALGAPAAVELLYDPQDQVIGFRAVDVHAEHARFVRSSTGRQSGPYVITVIAFLRFYGIDIDVTRRWPASMRDDVLSIDLTTTGTPVTSNRAKRSDSESIDG